MTTKVHRIYPHTPRRTADGRYVCQGGPWAGPRCEFLSSHYNEAVTHATQNGGRPPDAPREVYA